MPLSLVSLNIEGDRHLDKVLHFLKEHSPDVLCLQEVFEKDFQLFEKAVGSGIFAPMNFVHGIARGVGIVSRLSMTHTAEIPYVRGDQPVVEFDPATAGTKYSTQRSTLVVADMEYEGVAYRVGTTHFTWTSDGEADDNQRRDLSSLLAALKDEGELVFCGDFNAPRGKEIFAKIAERYTDNIPLRYTTSIDAVLHRKGALPYMVDGLFSTPAYAVSDVTLEFGVSDHAAIVATIAKSE
jgi:endonuclease/exonuclease/phosphatase family metal-dependent hydrolase